jgi:sugar O-acyltransferase (sialic acid O-acetyltransferase NeuD family)
MYIVGAGGFASEIADICYDYFVHIDAFVVSPEFVNHREEFCDRPLLSGLDKIPDEADIIIAIGDPRSKAKAIDQIPNLKRLKFVSMSHSSVTQGRYNSIGDGVVICAGTRITNNITIMNMVTINLNCTIGHGAKIWPFTTLSPGVHISGDVEIGKFVFIGTGAVIGPKVKIGEGATIGAGSVILRDVDPDIRVHGFWRGNKG